MKYYICLSTIPSRFKHIEDTIETLVNQSRLPERIILSIPRYYKRFKDTTITEEQIKELSDKYPLLQVHRCDHDYGPATKFLGALEIIPSNSYALLVDDDILYHRHLLKSFIEKTPRGYSSSMNVYNLPYSLLTTRTFRIGQGYKGFFIPTSVKDDIFKFYDLVKDEPGVFFDDDVWMSFFLNKKGIPIKAIPALDFSIQKKDLHLFLSDSLSFKSW